MNIPEVTNELRQEPRSESLVHAKSVDRSHVRDGTAVSTEAIKSADSTSKDKTSSSLSKDELQAVINDVEERLEKNDVSLKFNILEEDDTVQVEIVDGDGKTIRKIPDDDFLKMSESLKNFDRGFLDKNF